MATAENPNSEDSKEARVSQTPSEPPRDPIRERMLYAQCANWTAYIRARGQRYERCRLANYETGNPRQTAAVQKLLAYAESCQERIAAGVNVVLYGGSGTGKDHLVTGLVHATIKRYSETWQPEIHWQSGPGLFAECRKAIADEADDPLRKYRRAAVLVVSDLIPPCGTLTDYQSDVVYRLLDARYNDLRPLWVTLNVKDRAALNAAIGVAAADRLIDGAVVIPCDWDSYRKPVR